MKRLTLTLTATKRLFPFANLAMDLLKWSDPENKSSLKIFGSYAATTGFNVNDYALSDLSSINSFSIPSPGGGVATGFYTGNVYFVSSPVGPTSFRWAYWMARNCTGSRA
jgi:hypothetical protein